MGRIPRNKKTPGRIAILPVDEVDGSVCFCLRTIQTFTHLGLATVDRMVSVGIVVSALQRHKPLVIEPQPHCMAGIEADLLPEMPFADISTSIARISKRPPYMRVTTQIGVAVIRCHARVMSVQARHQHRSIRRANRRVRSSGLQLHSLAGQGIEIRRQETPRRHRNNRQPRHAADRRIRTKRWVF